MMTSILLLALTLFGSTANAAWPDSSEGRIYAVDLFRRDFQIPGNILIGEERDTSYQRACDLKYYPACNYKSWTNEKGLSDLNAAVLNSMYDITSVALNAPHFFDHPTVNDGGAVLCDPCLVARFISSIVRGFLEHLDHFLVSLGIESDWPIFVPEPSLASFHERVKVGAASDVVDDVAASEDSTSSR